VVGRFGAPYGVKGWVRVVSYTDPPANLLIYRPWRLRREDGWADLEVAGVKPHQRGFVAQIAGVTDRTAAERFVGREIGVPEDVFPDTVEDEYYWKDLVGLDVDQCDGRRLGRVSRLFETGSRSVLVVSYEGGERLIPFVSHYVLEIDLEARRMVVDWAADD